MKCLLKDQHTGLSRPLAQALGKKEAAAEADAGTGFLQGGFGLGQTQGSGQLFKPRLLCFTSPVSGSVVGEKVPQWIKIFNQCPGDPDAAGPQAGC